jgi:hypothetical protein
VLLNSTAWGMHMGLSSNIRYQALYGIDMVRLCAAWENVGVVGGVCLEVLARSLRTALNVLLTCAGTAHGPYSNTHYPALCGIGMTLCCLAPVNWIVVAEHAAECCP